MKFKDVYTCNCLISNLSLNDTDKISPEFMIKEEIDSFLKEGYAVKAIADCVNGNWARMVRESVADYIEKNYNVKKVKHLIFDYYILNEI